MMKKMGFQKTLLLSISILIAVCLIASNSYSYLLIRDKTISGVNQESIHTAAAGADKIESWFRENANVIDALSKSYQEFGGGNENYVNIAEYAKSASDLATVLLAFDDGRAYSTIQGSSWDNGVAILEKYDARKRGWYDLGKSGNQLNVTDVFTSASSGKELVGLVKPIDSGVLLGTIELDIL